MSKRLRRLKALAARGSSEFVDQVLVLLADDFRRYLEVIRNQKLLNTARDLQVTERLATEFQKRVSSANLTVSEKRELEHHLQICVTFQSLFDEIDRRGAELDIWDFALENIVVATLDYVEQSSVEHIEKFVETYPAEASARERLRHGDRRDRSFRDDCDSALIVLNQATGRSKGVKPGVPPIDSVKCALELASEFQFALLMFDFYSFRNWKIQVKGKSIRIVPRVSSIEKARELSHLRKQALDDIGASKDLKAVASIPTVKALEGEAMPDGFEEFMTAGRGECLFRGLREYRDAYRDKVKTPIEVMFDSTDHFHVGADEYSIEQVIEAWAFVRRLMGCGRVWQGNAFVRKHVPNKTPILSTEVVIKLASEDLGLSQEEAKKHLGIFTNCYPAEQVDLFYRPLTPLPGNKTLVPVSYIELSRFERNILPILLENTDYDVSPKGFKPLLSLARKLRGRDLRVTLNKNLVRGNRAITDIDCAIVKGNHLFVAQVKIVRESDSVYEEWRIDRALRHAAQQLVVTVRHIDENRKITQDVFGLRNDEFILVPFILTNVYDLSGAQIEGFSVVDIDYLEEITRSELKVVRLDYLPMDVTRIRNVPEHVLKKLIEAPTVRRHFENPSLRDERITTGSFTLSCAIHTN